MGFLSFHLAYYKGELQKLGSAAGDMETVYHARQLLKILDDLVDEGYTELNDALEASCQGVSRLRAYLRDHHAEPFPLCRETLPAVTYEDEELELCDAIRELTARAAEVPPADPAFPAELVRFCDWIGYEADTACIFLLRDTLLPYICFQQRGWENIHPWLLSRKALERLTGKAHIDDALRAPIFSALKSGRCHDYDTFCQLVLPEIRAALKPYPEAEHCLSALLGNISGKRIIVVESGCTGTFPLLLKSLDKRVEPRMYTTYPWLLKYYGQRIYTPKYEENRRFETLYAQERYFQFSDLRDGHFYVKRCQSEEVKRRAYGEVSALLAKSAWKHPAQT